MLKKDEDEWNKHSYRKGEKKEGEKRTMTLKEIINKKK